MSQILTQQQAQPAKPTYVRMTETHFRVLDVLYQVADPIGLTQEEIASRVVLTKGDGGVGRKGDRVPITAELGELLENGFVWYVMHPTAPDEPLTPRRFWMSCGQYGLRDKYDTLCAHYERKAPPAPPPESLPAAARLPSVLAPDQHSPVKAWGHPTIVPPTATIQQPPEA